MGGNPYRGRGGKAYQRHRDSLARRCKANGIPCHNCGRPFSWDDPNGPRGFTADHPIALNNGGRLLGQQLVPLCRSCNARKGDSVAVVLRSPS